MTIGTLVEWHGVLGIITSFDKEGDPFLYIFKGKYTILICKEECTAPQANRH
jgi:hypothetical protein